VLASLAEEPKEFAENLEVLDSIVKIYTVFARCVCRQPEQATRERGSGPGQNAGTA
jgi:hypothetical protein